jgi:AmiR/NasT family two-component response regulator
MSAARVLILEPSLKHARFIEEALAEAQETRATSLRLISFHLQDFEDAVVLLESEPREAILLGMEASGRPALDSFLALRQAAPQAAVIALVRAEDGEFGRALLRRGAQDYFIRYGFDHISIARALENAIERQRFLFAAENSAVFDPMTGLLNQKGLLLIGQRLGSQAAFLTVCEMEHPAPDPETNDAILLSAADQIRAASNGSLAARCDHDRFAILSRVSLEFSLPGFRSWCVAVTGGEDIGTALACENKLP